MKGIVAIIQARVGSTRLPKKVLLDLKGKTVLERVIERVARSRLVNKIVVATTTNSEDDEIVKVCGITQVGVYRGSEEDVLDRYFQTAKTFCATQVVRITSDCPLIDPKLIDKVIEVHLEENADYTANTIEETYPDGQDIEVIKFSALETAWKNAIWASEREHVTPYVRKNPDKFKLVNVRSEKYLADKRWTLDNPEDYEFIKAVYQHFQDNGYVFGMEEVLALIAEKPELELINKHIPRNEGYQKSLREDRIAKNG